MIWWPCKITAKAASATGVLRLARKVTKKNKKIRRVGLKVFWGQLFGALFINCVYHSSAYSVQPMTPDKGVVDPDINKLARYRASKSGKSGKNAARDFHRFIHRDGQTFPAKITYHRVPIRTKVQTTHGKRKTQECLVQYPVILLSSWMKSILETYPCIVQSFLGSTDSLRGAAEELAGDLGATMFPWIVLMKRV